MHCSAKGLASYEGTSGWVCFYSSTSIKYRQDNLFIDIKYLSRILLGLQLLKSLKYSENSLELLVLNLIKNITHTAMSRHVNVLLQIIFLGLRSRFLIFTVYSFQHLQRSLQKMYTFCIKMRCVIFLTTLYHNLSFCGNPRLQENPRRNERTTPKRLIIYALFNRTALHLTSHHDKTHHVSLHRVTSRHLDFNITKTIKL